MSRGLELAIEDVRVLLAVLRDRYEGLTWRLNDLDGAACGVLPPLQLRRLAEEMSVLAQERTTCVRLMGKLEAFVAREGS